MAGEDTGRACSSILRHMLRITRGERLLLVYDRDKERIADVFMQEASELRVDVRRLWFPSFTKDGCMLPSLEAELRTAVGHSHPTVILMSPAMFRSAGMDYWFSLIGSPFKPSSGRLFSDWVLPKESFARIYSVDWSETARYRDALLERLAGVKRITIATEAGTDISIEPRGWVSGGIGEIYTAPVEESVNGVIVYDASIYWGKPKAPIRLRLERGRIVEVESREHGEQLQMFLKDVHRDEGASTIAELGVGLNLGADAFSHVMEAEQARRTCHFDLR